jgi:hypothetical protein
MIFGSYFLFSGSAGLEGWVWELGNHGGVVWRIFGGSKALLQICDVPKPFLLNGEAGEPFPVSRPPTYRAHQTLSGEVSKSRK